MKKFYEHSPRQKEEVVFNDVSKRVPRGLKLWFIAHFVVDVTFAVPLFIMPRQFLLFLRWTMVDPITTRMAAAALFGIGIESFLSRNKGIESYQSMLTLKIIWSSAAIIGLSIALIEGNFGLPVMGASLLAVFLLFNLVWIYWLRRLSGSILRASR